MSNIRRNGFVGIFDTGYKSDEQDVLIGIVVMMFDNR